MLAQLESSTRLEGGGGEEGELACALRLTTHSRGEAVTAAKQLRSRRLQLLLLLLLHKLKKGQPQ